MTDAERANNGADMNLDWDSGLDFVEEKEYSILPIGEYEFTVVNLEKTYSKAGSSMGVITLDIITDQGQHSTVKDYLVLSEPMAWKLSQFFHCVGLQKKGETLKKMPWNKVVGAEGRVSIKHDTFNDRESAKVNKYLSPMAKPKVEDTGSDLPFEI